MLAFPRNSGKATLMGMEWEREIFIEDEVKQGGQTRWGLVGSCEDFGFAQSNLSSQGEDTEKISGLIYILNPGSTRSTGG